MPNVIRRALCKLLHLYFETNAKCKRNKGVVLMLHDVGGNGGEFDVSDEAFSELLEKLGRKNLVRLENWEKEDEFIALTIDDVPETFYKNAYPSTDYDMLVKNAIVNKDGKKVIKNGAYTISKEKFNKIVDQELNWGNFSNLSSRTRVKISPLVTIIGPSKLAGNNFSPPAVPSLRFSSI